MSGRRRGAIATTQRAGLLGLALVYRAVLRIRNHWYDRLAMPRWLDVPVISIGNMTVGGTGKSRWPCGSVIG